MDLAAAEADGMAASAVDRLRLTEARIEGMAGGLRQVASLPDPVGEVLDGSRRPNGLDIQRVRVPLGVVAVIYENRPNVTSDAAGICVKAGNAALLRGSGSALHSNRAVADVLRDGMVKAGLPADAVILVDDVSHEAAVAVMQLTEYVDCLIPRGGPRSSRASATTPRCRSSSTATATATSTSTQRADLDEALRDRGERQDEPHERVQRGRVAPRARGRGRRVPARASPTRSSQRDVELVGDDGARDRVAAMGVATDDDFGREYLDLKFSVAVVPRSTPPSTT